MPNKTANQTLSGSLLRLLYSPKGAVEGFLIAVRKQTLQVSVQPEELDVDVLSRALGRRIEVKAKLDHSPKTREAPHPVYKLDSITKVAGKTYKSNSENHAQVRGLVASIHFAKHGEPNGVILESGEFIHTRPHGMKKLNLRVGSKVVARGERRLTVMGTFLIEARDVNRVRIE